MPNGHGAREEDEQELIQRIADSDWHYADDPPGWVVDAAKSDDVDAGVGFKAPEKHYYGDYHVYKARSSVHGSRVHVFYQVRRKHLPTDNDSGACGNCGKYVERQSDDRFLRCARCGWVIGLPLLRRVLY